MPSHVATFQGPPPEAPPCLWTIGHSSRTADDFVALLAVNGISRLVDVRTVPRSRRNPQFDGRALASTLPDRGIGYVHLPGLGGLRKPRPDSINTAWDDAGMRGYADHMLTDVFARSLATLLELLRRERVGVMCAEADPARCHRNLLADAATAAGIEVRHILGESAVVRHTLSPLARVEDGRVTYPGPGRQGTLW